jgi:fluoroacetyl-CoA thioesterase
MKDTLTPGITHQFTFRIPESKTVPHLFPEAAEFQAMPKVLATGFLVGLIEWTCIQAVLPHMDWPREQTVGIGIHLNHTAATPPGFPVTVSVTLTKVAGKRLKFEFSGQDGVDEICSGTHDRFVIDAGKFAEKLESKTTSLSV